MLSWMIQALVPAALLAVAALLAEQAAIRLRLPVRGIWILAMALSLGLPFLGQVLPAAAPTALAAALAASPVTGTQGLARQVEGVLPLAWLALSLASLGVLALGAALLRWKSRAWRRGRMASLDVFLSRNTGPAVFGWLRPAIVVPGWLECLPPHRRDLALAHERSHIGARDPQLLAGALLLLAAMPWNLPLWWQFRRLRSAIEIDCDARVIGAGADLVDYGETLIDLGRQSAHIPGLLCVAPGSKTFLERRIRIMTSSLSQRSRIAIGALVCAAIGTAAIAAELAPPPTDAMPTLAQAAEPPGRAGAGPATDVDASGPQALEALRKAQSEAQARVDELEARADALEARLEAESEARAEAEQGRREAEDEARAQGREERSSARAESREKAAAMREEMARKREAESEARAGAQEIKRAAESEERSRRAEMAEAQARKHAAESSAREEEVRHKMEEDAAQGAQATPKK